MAARRKAKAANSPKRGRGRPSDYRPELCDMVRKLALLGLTDEDIAGIIGKPMTTFNRWKAEHDEFREALKQAKKPADGEVAFNLYRRANGVEWDEQQPIKLKEITYDPSTGRKVSEIERIKLVTVRKILPPDTMACMYWLNNRDKDRWRQRQEVTGAGGKPLIPEEPNWDIVRDGLEGKLGRIAAAGAAASMARKA